ncbi:MAG: 16S rRNA (cytosine(1402)-N(4))-methyltransferase RsmH [Acidobacteriota bacterium]|jgi:16S rRNA (cytosine1402-N4)-methyltransferase
MSPDADHVPVLVDETLRYLLPERPDSGRGLFVDATVGLGGHAEALLEAAPGVRLLGIDRDPRALERAGRRLARFGDRVRLAEGAFSELAALAERAGEPSAAGVYADLGVSSLQLDTAERGFSFRFDAPLDMRMGTRGPTAAEIVNSYPEADLARIFREYGEERQARRIARTLVEARRSEPVETTGDLRRLILEAKGGRPGRPGRREGRVDPATRVFQALRIEVNRELDELERFLEEAVQLLELDGRLVVISYHSLEDRIVKNTLRDLARGEVDEITGRPRAETRVIEVLTKKPITPSPQEVAANPRSRSAKLRAARRRSVEP